MDCLISPTMNRFVTVREEPQYCALGYGYCPGTHPPSLHGNGHGRRLATSGFSSKIRMAKWAISGEFKGIFLNLGL